MLDLDPSVTLALALSVASAVLCAGYGLRCWNADDDPAEDAPDRVPTPADTDRVSRNDGDGV